jgi:hypothetical protein
MARRLLGGDRPSQLAPADKPSVGDQAYAAMGLVPNLSLEERGEAVPDLRYRLPGP